jgi:predicted transposase YdaD
MAAKTPSPVLEMSVTEAKASLQKSIADWISKQEKISLTAAKFEEDRQSLASRIRSMGFTSTADISKTPSHRKIAEEYAELQSQIATLRKRESGYKTAIEEVRSSLRRLERQEALETAGISTVELEQLARTVAETDERLENSSKSGEKSPVEIEIWLKEALTPGSN